MALVSSSRTPREQMLMKFSYGRAQLDVMRVATNPSPHGRKPIDVTHKEAKTAAHKTGKKKVDPKSCRAAAVAEGSATADVPLDKKHIQRRHYDKSSIISVVELREEKPIKRGTAHVAGPASKMDPKEDNIYSRKTDLEEDKKEFRRLTSPVRREFTFQPKAVVDHRDPEARLLADGSKRKERGHHSVSATQALTTPWATAA